jgi:hypothetical protein
MEHQQQNGGDTEAIGKERDRISSPLERKLGEDRHRPEGNRAHGGESQSYEIRAVGGPGPSAEFYGVGVAVEPVECAQTWNP